MGLCGRCIASLAALIRHKRSGLDRVPNRVLDAPAVAVVSAHFSLITLRIAALPARYYRTAFSAGTSA
jgi:hypothetical protein